MLQKTFVIYDVGNATASWSSSSASRHSDQTSAEDHEVSADA